MSVRIGLDIGGTNLRIGAADETGLRAFRKIARTDVLNGTASGASLASYLRDYIRENALGEVNQIVIGVPATVSADHRTVLQAPNIPGMDQLPLADELEAALHVPVRIERDVNPLLAQDMAALNLPTEGICVGIYFGTGIGNAIFIDGKPYNGRNGVAGELGHWPVIGNSERCGCGNIGCTECVASGLALQRIRAEHFPDTDIAELFVRHGDSPVLADFIDRMACVAAGEWNLLDPEAVVIGGGLPAMKNFPREAFVQAILRHARKPFPAQNNVIVFSDGAPENGVRGALLLAERFCK